MSVLIGDVNDNVPRFTQPAFEVTLSEGTPVGTTVTRVEAEDPDIASSLSYSFVSDGAYEIQFIILVFAIFLGAQNSSQQNDDCLLANIYLPSMNLLQVAEYSDVPYLIGVHVCFISVSAHPINRVIVCCSAFKVTLNSLFNQMCQSTTMHSSVLPVFLKGQSCLTEIMK